MKKGFTLVEILGVITILGILALIAVPTIDAITNKNKEKLYQAQLKTIKSSMMAWGDANIDLMPDKGESSVTLTLGDLKVAGFISEKFEDPRTGFCFKNSMILTITPVENGWNYIIDEESGLYGTKSDCIVPVPPKVDG